MIESLKELAKSKEVVVELKTYTVNTSGELIIDYILMKLDIGLGVELS